MKKGFFGAYGGNYIPETLLPALNELEKYIKEFNKNKKYRNKLSDILKNYCNRPTPLYFAENLTKKINGANIYLKREDLLHTGSHKINNTIGQGLLTCFMGKKRIIAETGAGQHGVASATAAAIFNLKCEVYMGEEDMRRQALNVYRMKMLGAEVIPVTSGTRTLKDACSEAIRDWVANSQATHYLIGSVVGPHPYPTIVRNFQKIIGTETKRQFKKNTGKALPDAIVACVGGGSNSIGIFYDFIKETKVKLYGIEADGPTNNDKNAASLSYGRPGVLHGSKTYLLQDKYGQIKETASISAGLDYPGVGPEHSYLKDTKRVEYLKVNDAQAIEAFKALTKYEGIIPALESAHAVYYGIKLAKKLKKGKNIIINLSGRGDKDILRFLD